MGHFIPSGGGGSSSVLCTATAAEVLKGYKALTKDSPLPVEGTLSASGDAGADTVLTGKTFYSNNFKSKQTGTMPNRGQYQYAGGFGSGSGYVSFSSIPAGYYGPAASGWAPEIRMSRDTFKNNVINYFGIGSVTNFKIAQYSSQKLQFTWANATSKMWSGIRIVGKQGGWPSSVTDGTVVCDSAAQSYITGELATGTWYFRAWNYVTASEGKWYGGYSQASINNATVSGEVSYTSGGSWTVPTGVRRIRYFLVGGGGGSYRPNTADMCGGGGGGYTTTGYADVIPGQVVYITVGSGGNGTDGGASSLSGAVNATASGGKVGTYWHADKQVDTGSYGGNGGSGGGQGGSSGSKGGSDGSNGGGSAGRYGIGQGVSTRCPWDNTLYAGAGGGAGHHDGNIGHSAGDGGDGGGGRGFAKSNGENGQDGYGGGGGGVNGYSDDRIRSCGGSGIVRIKW